MAARLVLWEKHLYNVHVMTVAPVDFADSVVEVHEMPGVEGPNPNIILGFRGGEMWHAVAVLARERHVTIGVAFAGVLAVGLNTLGYAVDDQVAPAIQAAMAKLTS